MSTQPDSLVAALQLAQQQLTDRTQALADAKQTITLLVDGLTALASVLNDTSVKLAAAIQSASKVKGLLGS